jgi:hypothetical protein
VCQHPPQFRDGCKSGKQGEALSENDVAGDGRQTRARWRAIYLAVMLFALALIVSLIAFSNYFSA